MWGYRNYQTDDSSRNNLIIGFLSNGEGWHNNHHAHPVSARHGLKWYEFDLNWYAIWILQKLGLARRVYRVKLSELEKQDREKLTVSEAELVSI